MGGLRELMTEKKSFEPVDISKYQIRDKYQDNELNDFFNIHDRYVMMDADRTHVIKYDSEDPTFFRFKLLVDQNSPLFYIPNGTKHQESAYHYLLSVNQLYRAQMFKRFVENFNYLIYRFPYYLTEMSGLSDIYKVQPGVAFQQRTLIFKAVESIDLFISSMAHDYIFSVYDFDNMKEIVPDNLLKFDLYINLMEFRKFRTFISEYDKRQDLAILSGKQHYLDEDGLLYLNRHLGYHMIKFKGCKFLFDATNIEQISNSAPKMLENKFSILTGKMDLNLTNLKPFTKYLDPQLQNKYGELSAFISSEDRTDIFKYRDSQPTAAEPTPKKTKWENLKDGIKNIPGNVADNLKHNSELLWQIRERPEIALWYNLKTEGTDLLAYMNPLSYIHDAARDITAAASQFSDSKIRDFSNYLDTFKLKQPLTPVSGAVSDNLRDKVTHTILYQDTGIPKETPKDSSGTIEQILYGDDLRSSLMEVYKLGDSQQTVI